MAFCIDQAAIERKEKVGSFHQEEMLPDVACIARMHSVIVFMHR